MNKSGWLSVALILMLGSAPKASAQRSLSPEERAERERRLQEELQMSRPVAALDSVWLEELNWIEIRDTMKAGKTTVLVPTGGIEQNGPYVAMGKHNYILETACEDIARELQNALCAPIIKLVPEGNIQEPTGHMRYPGTLSVREETFEAMLEDVGESLATHGFDHVVYIGDSGGNQRGMAAVAERLNARWSGKKKTRAYHIAGYYDNEGLIAYMNQELGIVEKDGEFHDSYWITALQMLTDPETVRYEERIAAGKASVNGISIADLDHTLEVGRKLMKWRVDRTVKMIQDATGRSSGTQN